MSDALHGQLAGSAAEVYESFFVPALFGQWPRRLLAAAGVEPGDAVLDVGCGTGVLARAAAGTTGPRGSVVGVDINEGMLAVARTSSASVIWQTAAAEELPYADSRFDRTLSQFALMFFADRAAALGEMARVTRRDGGIGLATWSSVEHSPGYAAMVRLLDREIGLHAGDALRAPFCLGTPDQVAEVVGPYLEPLEITERPGTARFASIDAWLHTDIRGWTLADMIDDDAFDQLLAAARVELAGFVDDLGRVAFPAPAIFAVGQPVK